MNERRHRFSSTVSSVYSTHTIMHFDTTRTQRSFVHSTTMSLLSHSTESLLCSLLETANQLDAASPVLSRVERCGTKNSNSKTRTRSRFRMRMPHVTFADLYTSSAPVRQRKRRFPGQHYLLKRQWTSILPGPSCPSAETNRSRFGVGLGLILTPNMATSWSISGPLSRGSTVSRYLNMDPE